MVGRYSGLMQARARECIEHYQARTGALNHRLSGIASVGGDGRNIAPKFPRVVCAFASKRTQPRRILEREGDGFRLTHPLHLQRSHPPVRADREHKFDGTEPALDALGHDAAERGRSLINPIKVESVFVPGGGAADSFSHFRSQSAQDKGFRFVPARGREKFF